MFLKVTHIVFRDGYRKTYDKAIERNIPLVSARWVEYSRMAGKMLNPADYPPVDIEKYKVKYTKTRIINSELPVSQFNIFILMKSLLSTVTFSLSMFNVYSSLYLFIYNDEYETKGIKSKLLCV